MQLTWISEINQSRPWAVFPFKLNKTFCENKIKLILCTVGDRRSNEVVQCLIYIFKQKLIVITFNKPKTILIVAIDKIICNIRSTKQSSLGRTFSLKHFNNLPYNFSKSLVSPAIGLDEGKSIMSKERAQE